MKDIFVRQVLAVLAGGFISVCGSKDARVWMLLFCVVLLAGTVFVWKPGDFAGRTYKPEVILLSCSLFVGFLYGIPAENRIATPLVIENVAIEARLIDWSLDKEASQGQIILAYAGQNADLLSGKKYNLRAYPNDQGNYTEGWDTIRPGDLITLTGRLEQPKAPGTDGEFNLQLYNAVRGISGTITAKGKVQIVEAGTPGFT